MYSKHFSSFKAWLNKQRHQTKGFILLEAYRYELEKWPSPFFYPFATGYLSVSQGKGSRVNFAFNNQKATIHKPHPQPELKRYSVKKMKQFLQNSGIDKDLIFHAFLD